MVIVDAFNVLQTEGVLPSHLAGGDLPSLVRMIEASRYHRTPVLLVCDGTGNGRPSPARGLVRIAWAGHHREADDLIEAKLEHLSHARRALVVSSDRRLRAAARRVRARWIPSDAFLRQLAADDLRNHLGAPDPRPAFTRDIPLDPVSVAQWMEEFDVLDQFDQSESEPEAPMPVEISSDPGSEVPSSPDPDPDPDPDPGTGTGRTVEPPSPTEIEPWMLDALEHWAGRLDLDDLDMKKWLDPDET